MREREVREGEVREGEVRERGEGERGEGGSCEGGRGEEGHPLMPYATPTHAISHTHHCCLSSWRPSHARWFRLPEHRDHAPSPSPYAAACGSQTFSYL